MTRLLALAAAVFGHATSQRVFEPLVADWQRELASAVTAGRRARVIVNGSLAFTISVVSCLVNGNTAMPAAALFKGLTVLALSTLVLVLMQLGLNATALRAGFPFEMQVRAALPLVLPVAIPLALLPAMMLMRGAGRITGTVAALLICAATIATYLTAGWLTPRLRGDVREQLHEQIYQLAAAEDRAGRFTYPGSASRHARQSSPEQRRADLERWRSSPPYLQGQAQLTRPQWGRSTIILAMLTLATGTLGWALAGLGRTRPIQAAAWWMLAWLTLMVEGRFLYPGSTIAAIIPRAPAWLPLAVFATAAAALVIREIAAADPGRTSERGAP